VLDIHQSASKEEKQKELEGTAIHSLVMLVEVPNVYTRRDSLFVVFSNFLRIGDRLRYENNHIV